MLAAILRGKVQAYPGPRRHRLRRARQNLRDLFPRHQSVVSSTSNGQHSHTDSQRQHTQPPLVARHLLQAAHT